MSKSMSYEREMWQQAHLFLGVSGYKTGYDITKGGITEVRVYLYSKVLATNVYFEGCLLLRLLQYIKH